MEFYIYLQFYIYVELYGGDVLSIFRHWINNSVIVKDKSSSVSFLHSIHNEMV